MIYKAMGPFIGMCLFDVIKDGDVVLIIIVLISMIIMILPQIFIDKVLSNNFISQDEIPEAYFEEGLLVKQLP